MQSATDVQRILGQVAALAIMDETFKARLTEDPETVLREHGLELSDAPTIEVLGSYEQVPADAASSETLYLVVPSIDELSHEELSMVAGAVASCQSTASTAFTIPSCLSCVSTASTSSCT